MHLRILPYFQTTRIKSLKKTFFNVGSDWKVLLCNCAYFQTTKIKSLKNYLFHLWSGSKRVLMHTSTPPDLSPWKIIFWRLEWWKTCFDAFPDYQNQVLKKLFFSPLEWLKTCFYAFPGQQNQVPKKLIFHVWGGQKRVFKHLRILPDHQNHVLKNYLFNLWSG
jgi:hypothetical protein